MRSSAFYHSSVSISNSDDHDAARICVVYAARRTSSIRHDHGNNRHAEPLRDADSGGNAV